MTDITPDFNLCLKQHGASPVLAHDYDIGKANSFLQEAYGINARIADLTRTLRSIRPRYLSTAPQPRRQHQHQQYQHQQYQHQHQQHPALHDQSRPLTDREREAFDAQSKLLLRQLDAAVRALKQTEEVRNQTAESVALSRRARGGLGALGRWAAGGAATAKSPDEELEDARRRTVAAFREAVVVYVQRRLQDASGVQAEMMEVRLSREVEKSKSALHKSRAGMSIPYAQDEGGQDAAAAAASPTKRKRDGADEAARGDGDVPAELTQEQMQLFASENSEMLKHYEDQLDQVRKAEESILEISGLHNQLHASLEQQTEQIDLLVQDSYLTTENLGRGNKELKRASERRSTAQAVFYSTVAFCSFLVVWDLVF